MRTVLCFLLAAVLLCSPSFSAAVCTANPPFDITESFPEYAVVVKDGLAQFMALQNTLQYNNYISATLDTDGVFSHGFYMGTIPVNITLKVWYQSNAHTGPEVVEPICQHQEGKDAYRPNDLDYDYIAEANEAWVEDRFGRLHNPKSGSCDFTWWVEQILTQGDAPAETQLVPAENCTGADVAQYILANGAVEMGRLVYGPLASPFLTVRFSLIGVAFQVETIEGFTGRKRFEIPEEHQPAIDFWLHRLQRQQQRSMARE